MSQKNCRFSARVAQLEPSPIREILAVIDRPGMISFAGGLPAAETFPKLGATEIPPRFLQYGSTEGEPALRKRVADDLRALGLNVTPEQVLILSGSQQGIDLVAKLFIDPGTPVALEEPTYLAALQAFRFFGARFLPINASDAAFAYAIPTFQNPTGHCYPSSERAVLAEHCDRSEIPLFEDDPYRDLSFEPVDRTPVCSLLKRASWVYQGSFSKSLAPGLRLGFLAASPDLITPLVRLKQAADLHSNRVSQWLVLEQLEHPDRQDRIAGLAAFYRSKRDLFARALEKNFAGLARWKNPAGGLFFWLELNERIDTRRVLPLAIERGVAFMPGESFYHDNRPVRGTLRLNFSHASDEQIERGLAIMAVLAREQLGRRAAA